MYWQTSLESRVKVAAPPSSTPCQRQSGHHDEPPVGTQRPEREDGTSQSAEYVSGRQAPSGSSRQRNPCVLGDSLILTLGVQNSHSAHRGNRRLPRRLSGACPAGVAAGRARRCRSNQSEYFCLNRPFRFVPSTMAGCQSGCLAGEAACAFHPPRDPRKTLPHFGIGQRYAMPSSREMSLPAGGEARRSTVRRALAPGRTAVYDRRAGEGGSTTSARSGLRPFTRPRAVAACSSRMSVRCIRGRRPPAAPSPSWPSRATTGWSTWRSSSADPGTCWSSPVPRTTPTACSATCSRPRPRPAASGG